jgi:hypothetical protein
MKNVGLWASIDQGDRGVWAVFLGPTRVEAMFLHGNVTKPRIEIPCENPKISPGQKTCDKSDVTKIGK